MTTPTLRAPNAREIAAMQALPAAIKAQNNANDVCAQMRAECEYCGGTGDVHSLDGEWRGRCVCPAGEYQSSTEDSK